jgi:hypothetical protein
MSVTGNSRFDELLEAAGALHRWGAEFHTRHVYFFNREG